MRRARLPTALLCTLLSALIALAPGRSLALGPLEKNHPLVADGVAAYEAGRYEDALRAFDAAKAKLPKSAAVEYDRGNALYKLQRMDEAKQAYQRAIELDKGDLAQRTHYNLGNLLAELGADKEAIAAYRKALALDPMDDRARHNLEVMLRKVPPPPPPPQQQPDGGGDGGMDAGQDGGQRGPGDGGQQDGGQSGPSDGGSQQNPQERQADGGTPDPQPDEQSERQPRDGGMDERELSEKEVKQLLDSVKQSEKNLQLWRFQQRKKSRKDNAKDW